MGQREQYLEADANWYPEFTREERLNRWWSSASFGLALSGKAARAVRAADRAVVVAEAAQEMVRHQAVYALLEEGETVREIAEHLQLSRSSVGRIARRMTQDRQRTNLTMLPPHGASDETRDIVLDAWQLPDLTSSTQDHPRGTHEAAPHEGPTNFGGPNAS